MKVIGIKFKEGGKIYYFAPKKNEKYEEGMQVIVETSKSVEFATVAFPPKEVDESEVVQPLKPILRIATDKDREQIRKNAERKPQAMKIAQEKVEKHNLKMKLIDCEFTFDGSKIIFYFSADGRVDFRELVKDLASVFHIRIELRQVGARDETKLLGGIAPCGRECCCAGAMPDFRKVSIKMAKVQGLSLNPGKISGLCGRLMCCLSYENDYYSEVYKKMPKVGSEVSTPDGKGTVVSDNMLKLTVRVKIEKDGSLVYKDYPLKDIRFKGGKREEADEKVSEDLKDILD
ncbi:MAG TPA: stage 0 sporulation family protein [Candidatus Borkfalkia excrementavium]|uniref:Stage 0 sporulation family protein n=1 Tax=Candidatus Borkfalkia excrementavium TaxID=2838505 RepID=A0A9D1Z6N7_9FIRM|nr:stage 0 sporulation family protein [Candidatus Borkfalkia excrementavium]